MGIGLSDNTTLEGYDRERLPDGRVLFYKEVRGKRRYVVQNDTDKQALKDLLKDEKKRKVRRFKSQGVGARYQRKVRRRTVVKRHFPWLSEEQVYQLVNSALTEDAEYKKNPFQYLQKMALKLGMVQCCPTCGRGAEKGG